MPQLCHRSQQALYQHTYSAAAAPPSPRTSTPAQAALSLCLRLSASLLSCAVNATNPPLAVIASFRAPNILEAPQDCLLGGSAQGSALSFWSSLLGP
jgi:hypothetical protein